MVTRHSATEGTGVAVVGGSPAADAVVIEVDGTQPLSAGLIAALTAAFDSAEDRGDSARLIVRVSGAPDATRGGDQGIALVSRWERAVRRLERLRVATIAIATGDCGGPALDALLATDYRIADASLRLLLSVANQPTWPGMALYRLSNQTGAGAVRRAVLFGVPIEAADALALSLIDELTDDTAAALAAAVALTGAFSGTEVSIRRQLMLDAAAASFEDALGTHLAACDRSLRRASQPEA
jgi:isomerase DpgB